MSKDDFVTIAEAADMLGVSRTRVMDFVKAGRLAQAEMLGRKVIQRRDVQAFKKIKRAPGNPEWRKDGKR